MMIFTKKYWPYIAIVLAGVILSVTLIAIDADPFLVGWACGLTYGTLWHALTCIQNEARYK